MNRNPHKKELLSCFKLHPMKAAKISEISEATAASAIKLEDRVNFHIGNPIQDAELLALYRQLVLGFEIEAEQLNEFKTKQLLLDNGWHETQLEQVTLLCQAIEHAVPYLPQGGFLRSQPNKLAEQIKEWLSKNQTEPLEYDLGTETGKREIIFASGGVWESLSIFFSMLSHYLVNLPATIFVVNINLPPHL